MPPGIEGYSGLERIARGGFGVVYRAHQDRFDREVAVKVLSVVDLTDRDQQRFDRECRAMGALSWHPNVVAVYDSGTTDDGHPYLAMEFLRAGSLADRLQVAGPMAWPSVAQVGVQVASALGAAHAEGTLHRDLKPENILVGPFGEAKLGDFGIAAVSGSTQTTAGSASMTLAHVPPEVLAGERPDERSDVYSLASTLHTLLTGTPPFSSGNEEPMPTLMLRILQSPAPRLTGVPDGLADLLEQALAKDPGARPASAEELGLRLQAVQADAGVPVTELRLAPSGPVPAPGPDAQDGDDTPTIAGLSPVGVTAGAVAEAPAETGPLDARPLVAEPEAASEEPAPVGAVEAPSGPAVTQPEPVAVTIPTPVTPAPGPAGPPPSGPPPTGAAPSGPSPAREKAPNGRPRTRAVLFFVLAGLVALALVAIAAGLLARSDDDGGGGGGAVATTATAAAGEQDAGDGTVTPPAVTATVDVDPDPVSEAVSDDAVWVVHTVADGTVTRIDPSTSTVAATIAVGGTPRGIDVGAGAVWVANFDDGTVSRIDPATNEVTDVFDAGDSPRGLAADDAGIWVTNFNAGTVTRLDPTSGEQVATIEVGADPLRVAVASDQVWVTNNGDGTVTHIDPATNEVVGTVDVGDKPHSVFILDEEVLVSTAGDGVVSIVNPFEDTVKNTIALEPDIGGMTATGDTLWVANTRLGNVTRVDLASGEPVGSVDTGQGAADPIVFGDALWVSNTGADTVVRVEPADG